MKFVSSSVRNCHLLLGVCSLLLCQGVSAAPHRYEHVVVVIEENHAVGQILGDTVNAPYINSLAAGGVVVGKMFAIEHPSQPNYLQLFSGSNQGVLADGLPPNFSTVATATYPFTKYNLGSELIAAGFTFAGYSEELEAAGALDWADYDPHTGSGVHYRRKHNPWANWIAKTLPVPANQLPVSANKAFSQFPTNYSQLPTVSFVVPNQLNDMHDGSRKQGDTWLKNNLDGYAQWAKTHNSLLIVTWDEDDSSATNQIPTIFYGSNLHNGTTIAGTWTLHNLLRTLEDMYGSATHAGAAARVKPIVGPFTSDPSVLVKSFRQGAAGYNSSRDNMLRQTSPMTNNALTKHLMVDRDTSATTAGNQASQALIRFDNIFGTAPGQVPTGSTILSAKLILQTPRNAGTADYDSDDSISLHRMIRDWTDTATWNSLASGVSNNNIEAATTATFTLVPDVDGGPAIFDVTSDIALFKAGAANNRGWLLRASSGIGDEWTFKGNDVLADVTLRPTLEIVYSVP